MPRSTRTILKVDVPGQHSVTVEHVKPLKYPYVVTYGLQIKSYPTLMQAVAEYESCVIHALVCAGENV